jgi:DNA topoisomerase-1
MSSRKSPAITRHDGKLKSTDKLARQFAPDAPVTDPVESAKAAGLRYVSDHSPGITRRRTGPGRFAYVDPQGKPVRDADTLARIKPLAIPPAWTNVWICPDPRGHIQAVGRDDRGRKQYRYHPRWREVRDET